MSKPWCSSPGGMPFLARGWQLAIGGFSWSPILRCSWSWQHFVMPYQMSSSYNFTCIRAKETQVIIIGDRQDDRKTAMFVKLYMVIRKYFKVPANLLDI